MVGVRTLYPENKSNPSIISVFLNVAFGTGFDSIFVEYLCKYKSIQQHLLQNFQQVKFEIMLNLCCECLYPIFSDVVNDLDVEGLELSGRFCSG